MAGVGGGHMVICWQVTYNIFKFGVFFFCRKTPPEKNGAQTFCGYPGFFLEKKVKGGQVFPPNWSVIKLLSFESLLIRRNMFFCTILIGNRSTSVVFLLPRENCYRFLFNDQNEWMNKGCHWWDSMFMEPSSGKPLKQSINLHMSHEKKKLTTFH